MSYFKPRNRHLWVIPIEEEKQKEETTVLLPDNYKAQESEFAIVKIKDWAPDCKNGPWSWKTRAIVERRMLREIKVGENTYFVIQDNYVLGVTDED